MKNGRGKVTSFMLMVLLFSLIISNLVKAESISISFSDAEYKDIFQTLGELAGLNVLIDSSVVGKGSIELENSSFTEALDLVANLSGYTYTITENNLLVAAKERLDEYAARELRYVYTHYKSPDEIKSALAVIMNPADIHIQPNSTMIILSGTRKTLEKAEQLIAELDKPDRVTMQTERTVLEILQQLTQELGLDLIATPNLTKETLVVDVWQMDPWEVIEKLEEMVGLDVSISEHTLIATMIDETKEPERIKIYRLNHAEPETAAEIISLIVFPENVQIDTVSKSVMVRAADHKLKEIDSFMAEFDQPLPQVLMEVWIQEMSDDALSTFGLEWGLDFDGFKLTEDTDPNSPGYIKLSWEPWEIAFALKALENEGKVKVLASPKIATLSGKEASIFVGDRVPIVLSDDEGHERMDFLESGINLKVLPRISDDGYITIQVRPEVSTFTFVEGDKYPHIRTREAETIVRVKDGQPVLIGGLLQEQEVKSISKIPFLADLPILGRLFTKTSRDMEKTEMNIFLIPRIVDGSEGLVSSSFFSKTR